MYKEKVRKDCTRNRVIIIIFDMNIMMFTWASFSPFLKNTHDPNTVSSLRDHPSCDILAASPPWASANHSLFER
jgi:hypothetical protein